MKKNLGYKLLIAGMVCSLGAAVSGCGQKAAVTEQSNGVVQESASTAGTETESASESQNQESEIRVITDMAGREVEIPNKITMVYASNPVGSLITYTINDELMIGLNFDLSEIEKEFTTKHYQSLPNLGGWYGQGKTGNVEEIIKAGPELVISSGTNQNSIDSADQLQEQLGIPVICIDSEFNSLPDVYRFLGEALGEEARCEELALYCENTIEKASEIADAVPEAERVRVYYAEESAGLNTDPSGSPHARLIDLSGGINVADVEMKSGYGRTEVSMEQVITWDPQVIIACIDNGYADSGSYHTILTEDSWSQIQAVRDGKVYQTPSAPFNWFDRPPSVNTVIGLKWCQSLLYPEYVDYDMKQETKTFYQLFYHLELSDQDVEKILMTE